MLRRQDGINLLKLRIQGLRMKKQLTINDIAQLANVSKATVSFVLNNKDCVNEQTRQKVLSIIEQTNYRPSINSKRLYYHKSFTIAVVCDKQAPIFDNVFYYRIMSALLKRCMHYHYSLTYSEFSMEGDELYLPDNIQQRDVDGLIFMRDIPLPLIARLQVLGIPYVVIDDHSDYESLYTVRADCRLAACTAVQYLIEQGHRRIGFAGNTNLPSFYAQAFAGYQQALREAGLSMELSWFFDKIQDRQSMEQYIGQLLEQPTWPTAIFCMEDFLAIELIRYLQKRNVDVPEDISVIGIDDIFLADQIYPGLTTIAVDKEQMGASAVDILMDLINKKPTSSTTVSFNQVVVRESVKCLNGTEA